MVSSVGIDAGINTLINMGAHVGGVMMIFAGECEGQMLKVISFILVL